ncbi:Oidioi.mRNA.OKI2018_I69.chr1.g3204.t1.cds [Oikopleura dioica]|uniref:Oidioi.mRNA.OKI2018_I69.chr1.g3204.t1.cds n=1 Tax=Oikopleura dioica TaxID=34765 RepID=A0ABN7STF9_OIKDI|nr:Oidioi.mRNA.OKI2018_I69.chr1.g3204.t1.cds [Oikopleura dioica]
MDYVNHGKLPLMTLKRTGLKWLVQVEAVREFDKGTDRRSITDPINICDNELKKKIVKCASKLYGAANRVKSILMEKDKLDAFIANLDRSDKVVMSFLDSLDLDLDGRAPEPMPKKIVEIKEENIENAESEKKEDDFGEKVDYDAGESGSKMDKKLIDLEEAADPVIIVDDVQEERFVHLDEAYFNNEDIQELKKGETFKLPLNADDCRSMLIELSTLHEEQLLITYDREEIRQDGLVDSHNIDLFFGLLERYAKQNNVEVKFYNHLFWSIAIKEMDLQHFHPIDLPKKAVFPMFVDTKCKTGHWMLGAELKKIC